MRVPIFRLLWSFTKILPDTTLVNLKPGGPEDPPDILCDPLLSSPVSQREDPAPPPPDRTLTAPEAPTSPDPSDYSWTPPSYVPP